MGGDFASTLAAAEQLWKQGDHGGPWLALEELHPAQRTAPDVIDLRLRIVTNLGKWDMGDDLGGVLRYASDEDDEDGDYANRYRITVAEFQHTRARALVAEGDSRRQAAGEAGWRAMGADQAGDSGRPGA